MQWRRWTQLYFNSIYNDFRARKLIGMCRGSVVRQKVGIPVVSCHTEFIFSGLLQHIYCITGIKFNESKTKEERTGQILISFAFLQYNRTQRTCKRASEIRIWKEGDVQVSVTPLTAPIIASQEFIARSDCLRVGERIQFPPVQNFPLCFLRVIFETSLCVLHQIPFCHKWDGSRMAFQNHFSEKHYWQFITWVLRGNPQTFKKYKFQGSALLALLVFLAWRVPAIILIKQTQPLNLLVQVRSVSTVFTAAWTLLPKHMRSSSRCALGFWERFCCISFAPLILVSLSCRLPPRTGLFWLKQWSILISQFLLQAKLHVVSAVKILHFPSVRVSPSSTVTTVQCPSLSTVSYK